MPFGGFRNFSKFYVWELINYWASCRRMVLYKLLLLFWAWLFVHVAKFSWKNVSLFVIYLRCFFSLLFSWLPKLSIKLYSYLNLGEYTGLWWAFLMTTLMAIIQRKWLSLRYSSFVFVVICFTLLNFSLILFSLCHSSLELDLGT